jgi:hypothetical protein
MPKTPDELLSTPLENLDGALAADPAGREGIWAESLGGALAAVAEALRRHAAAAEAPGGPLAQVDLTRPTLVRQVSRLRQEHLDLPGQAEALAAEARLAATSFGVPADTVTSSHELPPPTGGGAPADVNELRARVRDYLAALRRHADEESGLLIESVTTDLGAGD